MVAAGLPESVPALGQGLALLATLGVVVLFRRKKDGPPVASDAPGPRSAAETPKRSLFRRGSDPGPVNPSISGGRATAPEYYEGPPEPPSARPARTGPPPSAEAQLRDLDSVLAQLDRLSEQIRRRSAARGGRGPPPSPPPGPSP